MVQHPHQILGSIYNANLKDSKIAIKRITAMWALCEAALGGILHAFKMPFTGLIIGSGAVIFISLIAYYSTNRKDILKATLIVLLVKAIVSPHASFTAFFAVLIQGVFGYLIFYSKRYFRLSVFALAIFTMIFSSGQKLLVLTIAFGNTLWESINIYTNFILNQLFSGTTQTYSVDASFIIIFVYVGIHLAAGIIVGYAAAKLPGKINKSISSNPAVFKLIDNQKRLPKTVSTYSSKPWWKNKFRISFFFIAILMISLSISYPELGTDQAVKIVIMIVRSILIIVLWFVFISPLLLKGFRKILNKRESNYSSEIEEVISSFPQLKRMVVYSWKSSSDFRGLKKIKTFINYSFILLLLSNFKD
jgi:hypothetical protein